MGRVRDWWERLTGTAATTSEPRHPDAPRARLDSGQPDDGLSLADGAPRGKPSRVGAAGFDPYASDAGYSKPHSWEHVDHD